MREVFHGWRRKVGCVTLVMALAVTILWMRSLVVRDVVSLGKHNGCDYWVTSNDGEIYVGTAEHKGGATYVDTPPGIRHWHITGTLCCLSAYLILWQPRKRTGPDHA